MSKYDLKFTKAVASGNDFIIIDDINEKIAPRKLDYSGLSRDLCRRHHSIGADGVLVLEVSDKADLRMRIINPDGSEVTMCGNGARCTAMYAAKKTGKNTMTIVTGAGTLGAEVSENSVKLRMSDPTDTKMDLNLGVGKSVMDAHFINTGVPHVVHLVNDIETYPVVENGRAIREHDLFQPEGTNANFVGGVGNNAARIRTYERGVEDETLACGTGTVASALVLGLLDMVGSPVSMTTQSREVLTVHYKKNGSKITDVYLEGGADIIYEGSV